MTQRHRTYGQRTLGVMTALMVLAACTRDAAEPSATTANGSIVFATGVQTLTQTTVTRTADDEPIVLRSDDGDSLVLTPTVSRQEPATVTRALGTLNEPNSFAEGDYIVVWGYTQTAGDTYAELFNRRRTLIDYETKEANSHCQWPLSPAGKSMRFYALHPNTAATALTPAEVVGARPTVSYQSDADIDLLYAESFDDTYKTGTTTAKIPLTFRHITTAVGFQADGLDISEVTLNDILTSGTYMPGESGNGTWTPDDTPAQSITYEGPGSIDRYHYLLPQDLTDKTVTVTTTDGKHYTGTLSGQWLGGHAYTYRLGVAADQSDYNFEITTSAAVTHVGGTGSFTVTSYNNQTNQPVGWTVTGYSDDGGTTWKETAPTWLTALTTSGSGSTTGETGTYTITAQTESTQYSHTEALKAKTALGTDASPYDLSTHDRQGNTTLRNTANCYVVSAPGTYYIPLAYGNGIRNGSDRLNGTQEQGKETKNYKGLNITYGYIYDDVIGWDGGKANTITVTSAELAWADTPPATFITNITYVGGNDPGIKFTISKENIKPGNAVIAAKDGEGTVVWSWHIWVTDEPIDNTKAVITYDQKHTYHMMPVNIGWLTKSDTYNTYTPRTLAVRVKQATSGKTAVFTIVQHDEDHQQGSGTYYQWGRPNALPTINKSGYRTIYDKNGTTIFNQENSNKQIISNYYEAIRYPAYLCNQSATGNSWGGESNTGIWGGTWSGPITKTLYDPCPVGFTLPALDAYTGFSTDGQDHNGEEYLHKSFWQDNYGCDYYCQPGSNTGETIYFPVTGYRSKNDGHDVDNTSQGYYWTSYIYDGKCHYFYFKKDAITVYGKEESANAYAIRPVRE